jgi:hypothetical protein
VRGAVVGRFGGFPGSVRRAARHGFSLALCGCRGKARRFCEMYFLFMKSKKVPDAIALSINTIKINPRVELISHINNLFI